MPSASPTTSSTISIPIENARRTSDSTGPRENRYRRDALTSRSDAGGFGVELGGSTGDGATFATDEA